MIFSQVTYSLDCVVIRSSLLLHVTDQSYIFAARRGGREPTEITDGESGQALQRDGRQRCAGEACCRDDRRRKML